MKESLFVIFLFALCGWSYAQIVPQKTYAFDQTENARVITVSVDSKRIVIGGENGSIKVFEPTTGEAWQLPSHQSKVNTLSFSFNSRYVAASSEEGEFSIYDFQDAISFKLNGATGIVKAIAFNPTGRIVATGNDDGKISLWDINSREKVTEFWASNEKILALAFSPDGRKLAWGGTRGEVVLWDIEKRSELAKCTGHKDWVRALSFNADGTTLVTGSYDKTIKLWNVTNGTMQASYQLHKSWVTDVRYSPDGKYLISGGADGQVIIFDSSGKSIHKITDVARLVCSAQFSYDGKFIVVADLTSTIKLYDCAALGIQPWKPFDVSPPTVVVLSPKLLATKDAATGNKKSIIHQTSVRLLLEVNDLSGVKQVWVDETSVQPMEGTVNRYQHEAFLSMNTEKTFVIKAIDAVGNVYEEKLLVESKPFSGGVNQDKYFALLIANEEYTHDDIQDLNQPVKDLQRLKNTLQKYYAFDEKNIKVLINAERDQLYASLDEFQAKLDKIDNLLIFYAGHGYWDDQLQQGYWLPSDAEPNKRSTWLSNGTLRDYIGGMGARHTLLVTDACFSGGIFKTRSIFEGEASAAIETLYLRKSRKAMTSGTLEKVPDKSVFIDFLIKRLEENAEDYITAEELFSGIRRAVINNSPSNQVPQYGEIGQTGDEGGEFIFIRKN